MFIVAFVVLVAIVVFLQIKMGETAAQYLIYEGDPEEYLIEPSEPFKYVSYVRNIWGWPILYIGLYEQFSQNIHILDDGVKKGFFGDTTKYHFMLMAHKYITKSVTMSIDKRGEYALGRVMLETGDFLGIRSTCKSFDIDKRVVVKPRKAEDEELKEILGGYIGDEIVHRFILEDPVLIYGYREYTGREPMKSIAWKQTARTGQMYVKEYDHTTEMTAGVILNIEGANEEEVESCYEVTRMVCEELEKNQVVYDFYTNAKLIDRTGVITWLPEGLGTQYLNNILYAMGRSDGTCLFSIEALLEMCEKKRKSAKSYIIITPKLTDENRYLLNGFEVKSQQKICVLEGGVLCERNTSS